MRRALLLGLIAASPLAAQSPSAHSFRLGFRLPVGPTSTAAAPVCDGSEMQGVERRRTIGKVLFLGGLGAMVAAPSLVNGTDPSTAYNVLALGGIASSVGVYLHYYSKPSEAFWQTTIPVLKVGQTTSADARDCFRKPSAFSVAGGEEVWTYNTTSPGLFGLGGSSRSVSLVFRNGVLSDVRRMNASF